jgi:hypothetical protein
MEINSPPYPKQNCSPRNLFQNLCELHDWASGQHTWANDEAARLNAPESPHIPPLVPKPVGTNAMTRFQQLSVPDMNSSWQAMRAIREQYDEIVRNYEDEADWNSDVCSYHQIGIVKAATLLLSVAFLDHEKREAKGADLIKKVNKDIVKALHQVLGKLQAQAKGEDDDDVFGDLFNNEDD